MDTTGILSSQLREWVKKFVGQPQAMMTLTFESFAFKHGLPVASDLVFDVRCLPNPYYDPALRPLTGGTSPSPTTFAPSRPSSTWLTTLKASSASGFPPTLRRTATI